MTIPRIRDVGVGQDGPAELVPTSSMPSIFILRSYCPLSSRIFTHSGTLQHGLLAIDSGTVRTALVAFQTYSNL